MSELKTFFPTICPSCGNKLIIEQGDKSASYKLMCKNPDCKGSNLKRLQKGIIALEIKGLGPKVIESLVNAGIASSLDLFNPEKFNEKTLVSSGEFKKGRALQKIMDAVKSTKSIPIDKAILSLQLEDIGKTFSEKIGKKLSGMTIDFAGLQNSVRDELDIKDSLLNKEIKESLQKFEEFGVEIIKYEEPKLQQTKTITKQVDISGFDDDNEIMEIIKKLDWTILPIDEKCQILIVPNKNTLTDKVDQAKNLGVKIMTIAQIKILFN
jgi:NAD-dependent DNA ligase